MTTETERLRTYAKAFLLQRISDLSEDALCASWAIDVSFAVWDMLEGRRDSYYRETLDADDIAELKQLAADADAWPWDHDTWVSLDRWRELHAKHEALEEEFGLDSAWAAVRDTEAYRASQENPWDFDIGYVRTPEYRAYRSARRQFDDAWAKVCFEAGLPNHYQ